MTLDSLCAAIEYRFADPMLLDQAMSHRSWCAEHDDAPSNERLEFLGDAVLGWTVAELVYRRFPTLPEGELTNLRKAVVNAAALAEVARAVSLGRHVKLGRGELAAGGQDKPSILSDALEALIGAVYLDGGAPAANALISRLVGWRIDEAVAHVGALDDKSRLQELLAAIGSNPPEYVVRSDGPDHAQHFYATVVVDGVVLGAGEGSSKKLAERVAAGAACDRVAAGATATPG